MNDRFAFFQHWSDHPEDETTPLVLADWLEERSDPRATFIRAAREWQLADRAVGENPESRDHWAACLAAMNQTKQTMFKLLGTQLRPLAGPHGSAIFALAQIVHLKSSLAYLFHNVPWLCEEPIHELTVTFDMQGKLTTRSAFVAAHFPSVERITLCPKLFRDPYNHRSTPWKVLEEWCDKRRFPNLHEIRLLLSGDFSRTLAWYSRLIPTSAWDALTIRVIPPLEAGFPSMWFERQISQFLESPLGSRLSDSDRECLLSYHRVGVPMSYDSLSVTGSDFYRFESLFRGQYRKGHFHGERSKWTQHAMRQTSVDANSSSAAGEGI